MRKVAERLEVEVRLQVRVRIRVEVRTCGFGVKGEERTVHARGRDARDDPQVEGGADGNSHKRGDVKLNVLHGKSGVEADRDAAVDLIHEALKASNYGGRGLG